jgi:type IV secretory pathway VirB4 component
MLAHNVEDQHVTLTPAEKSVLEAALYDTYRAAGISTSYETHTRRAPLLRDLYQMLLSEEYASQEVSLSLAQRLRRYTEGSLSGLFSDYTNIDLSNTVVQFDTKELDGELRPVVLLMLSNLIWSISFGSSIPRFLFIDELATMSRFRSGQLFLEEIFQRARKHFLSVTGITQHVNQLSETIVANCATHILLHQDDTTLSRVSDLFRLSPREAQMISSFNKGEALLLTHGKRMMARFVASPEEDKLITTNRRQIAKLEAAAAARLARFEVEPREAREENTHDFK